VDLPDTRQLWDANAPAWTELTRAGFDVHRDLVNTPAFFALLPPVDGLSCLDLGCGEGHNTRLLATAGARVAGLDIAGPFVRAAAGYGGSHIPYVLGDGCLLPFGASAFDAVTAFMSLMDVAVPEQALHEVARVLRPGGFAQFSVMHPAMTSPLRRWLDNGSGDHEAVAVGQYFDEGPVTETWIFQTAPDQVRTRHRPFTITMAHRTVSGWLNAVLGAGLAIEAVAEPKASEETAAAQPAIAATRTVPHFLIIRARKP
jgi:SAM-dependent methyltransferase